MENERNLNTFLFVYWGTKNYRKISGFQNSIKNILNEHIVEVYNLGQNGFLFSSPLSFSELRDFIPVNAKVPFILLEITQNIDKNLLTGFFPSLRFKSLKQLNKNYRDLDLDFILDKISKFGIHTLSWEEKEYLDNFENDYD